MIAVYSLLGFAVCCFGLGCWVEYRDVRAKARRHEDLMQRLYASLDAQAKRGYPPAA